MAADDSREIRDQILIENEEGQLKEYSIEALFDMEDQSYALLTSPDETILMRVEDSDDDQYLVGITDLAELDAVLSAYRIAVEHAPAEDGR